jgi:hypothetical protein
MTQILTKLDKGATLEEALRRYFIEMGYFTIRGVKVFVGDEDVTDIDLWLYMRGSGIHRQRILVDAKYKRCPQAMERLVWVVGAQRVFGAEGTIVATTDNRDDVRSFAKKYGVLIFNGHFLQRITGKYGEPDSRLNEEDFLTYIARIPLVKLDGDWGGTIRRAKSLLVTDLGFGAINHWIEMARLFADKAMIRANYSVVAMRCFYLILAFICIGFDYVMREIAFEEPDEKRAALAAGLRYGPLGKTEFDKTLELAIGLVRAAVVEPKPIEHAIRSKVLEGLYSRREQIISEYICRSEIQQSLFTLGCDFERLAMLRQPVSPSDLAPPLLAFVGCMLDAFQIARVEFFGEAAVTQS